MTRTRLTTKGTKNTKKGCASIQLHRFEVGGGVGEGNVVASFLDGGPYITFQTWSPPVGRHSTGLCYGRGTSFLRWLRPLWLVGLTLLFRHGYLPLVGFPQG